MAPIGSKGLPALAVMALVGIASATIVWPRPTIVRPVVIPIISPIVRQFSLLDTLAKYPYTTDFCAFLRETNSMNFYNEIIPRFGGAITLFVPSNLAFSLLPIASSSFALQCRTRQDLLRSLLLYMALPGRIAVNNLRKGAFLNTCQGSKLYVTDSNCINSGRILMPNLNFPNGIIHIVNRISFPVSVGSLWNTVTGCPAYSLMAQRLQLAGLSNALNGGPYTLFVPVNDAFSRLSQNVSSSLSRDPQLLRYVLTGHMVEGMWYSASLVQGNQVLTTAAGTNVLCNTQTVVSTKSDVDSSVKRITRFGKANILIPDIPCDNGVIHVIDSVNYTPFTCGISMK